MADDYWYPFYPGHYERDAGHLDHVADSCYRRLIDAYMRGGEPISRDPVRLMYITRTTPQQFQTVWPQLEGFFNQVNGNLHLKRCNVELDKQDAKRRFASEAGKRSAEKRKQQHQLLLNDGSTTVQRPFNDPCDEGRGGDKTGDITKTVPDPARANPVDNGDKKNGHNLGDPLRATRASPGNGILTPEQKKQRWEQNIIAHMRDHWPEARASKAIRAYLENQAHGKTEFELADKEMRALRK